MITLKWFWLIHLCLMQYDKLSVLRRTGTCHSHAEPNRAVCILCKTDRAFKKHRTDVLILKSVTTKVVECLVVMNGDYRRKLQTHY